MEAVLVERWLSRLGDMLASAAVLENLESAAK